MKQLKNTRGGKRPGAGMPKGYKTRKTLTKEAGRALLRDLVLQELRLLLAPQFANAKGLNYLIVRQKSTGKFLRVTEAMARVKLGNDEEIVEVWEKDPSVESFKTLLAYAIDKPAEPVQEVAVTGKLEVSWAAPT